IIAADPARLALPDHVHSLVALNRSPGRLVRAKALLGLHASFDRSMILLQDVVQILDRSMSAAAAQGSFLFHRGNRRAIEASLVSVDDAGLGMRWICGDSSGPGRYRFHQCLIAKYLGLFRRATRRVTGARVQAA